jgi:hypothetical protein
LAAEPAVVISEENSELSLLSVASTLDLLSPRTRAVAPLALPASAVHSPAAVCGSDAAVAVEPGCVDGEPVLLGVPVGAVVTAWLG